MWHNTSITWYRHLPMYGQCQYARIHNTLSSRSHHDTKACFLFHFRVRVRFVTELFVLDERNVFVLCCSVCIIHGDINRLDIPLYRRGNSLCTKILSRCRDMVQNADERMRTINESIIVYHIFIFCIRWFNWWMLHKHLSYIVHFYDIMQCSYLTLTPSNTQQPHRQFVHTYASSISILSIIYIWCVSFIEFMLMKFGREHSMVLILLYWNCGGIFFSCRSEKQCKYWKSVYTFSANKFFEAFIFYRKFTS